MHRLEFPIYGISVRPQGYATTTDIIMQSKTMLPKVILQRSEVITLEKKRIRLTQAKTEKQIKLLEVPSEEKRHEELKVQK